MPIHDWTRVDAGIFHDFHHSWIEEIKRALNRGLLPADYYALAEQIAGPFGPDVLTLQGPQDGRQLSDAFPPLPADNVGGLLVAEPRLSVTAEAERSFYRQKQSRIAVRHVSDDQVIAVIEVVSPGNKSSQGAMRKFIEKTSDFLEQGVHLLIIDLFPPTPRDPNGLHAAIWDDIAGQNYTPPAGKPLTLAAYESSVTFRAYVQPVAVGDNLAEMPLFLEPGGCVQAPLPITYEAAFTAVPARWRRELLTEN